MNTTPKRNDMKQIAQKLASKGRFGDSMLVHMAPEEVSGLASLMPDGELSINPDTGFPEAFFFLPMLAALGGVGAGAAVAAPAAIAGLGALGAGTAAGIGAAGIGAGLAGTAAAAAPLAAGAAAAAVAAARKLSKTNGLLLGHTNSNEVMLEKMGSASTDSVGYAAIVF